MPKKDTNNNSPNVVEERSSAPTETVDNPLFIWCNEFDSKRLSFIPTELGKDSKQYVNFPRYLYPQDLSPTKENKSKHSSVLTCATLPITMSRGGIPKYNEKYHPSPNAKERGYFYIPFTPADTGSCALFDMLNEIDNYMHDEINVKKNANGFLTYKAKSGKILPFKDLTYRKMVGSSKSSNEDELDEPVDPKRNDYVPYDRVKVQFKVPFEKEKDNDRTEFGPITTQLYVLDKADPEDAQTITDFEKYFAWTCQAQFALTFTKVWIAKNDARTCGITLKCKQIGITKLPEQRQNSQLNKKIFAFRVGASGLPTPNTKDTKDTKDTKYTKDVTKQMQALTVKETTKQSAKSNANRNKSDNEDNENEDDDENNGNDDNKDNEENDGDKETDNNDDDDAEGNKNNEDDDDDDADAGNKRKNKDDDTENDETGSEPEAPPTPVKEPQKVKKDSSQKAPAKRGVSSASKTKNK